MLSKLQPRFQINVHQQTYRNEILNAVERLLIYTFTKHVHSSVLIRRTKYVHKRDNIEYMNAHGYVT